LFPQTWCVVRFASNNSEPGDTIPVDLRAGRCFAYVQAGCAASLGRECLDVDILVAENRLVEVEEALLASGWAFYDLPALDKEYYRRWLQEFSPMRHLTRNTNLDLHHSLLTKRDKCYFESQGLIDRCISVGEGLSVLSPADMVLHSDAHIFRIGDWANALRDLSDQDLMLREFG